MSGAVAADGALRLVLDLLGGGLVLVGVAFFLAGTVGLLRFPDLYSRLHALTKADALGLGFVVLGLGFRPGPWAERVQLLLIWLLVLASTATVAHLMARSALDQGVRPVARRASGTGGGGGTGGTGGTGGAGGTGGTGGTGGAGRTRTGGSGGPGDAGPNARGDQP